MELSTKVIEDSSSGKRAQGFPSENNLKTNSPRQEKNPGYPQRVQCWKTVLEEERRNLECCNENNEFE